MEGVEFRKGVKVGTILRFVITKSHAGTTSVTYQATIFADDIESGDEAPVFSTKVTFVCLADDGSKKALPARG